jgi:hypothetical protein
MKILLMELPAQAGVCKCYHRWKHGKLLFEVRIYVNNIEQLAVNTIRILSAETVQKAKSGHPGLPNGGCCSGIRLMGERDEA